LGQIKAGRTSYELSKIGIAGGFGYMFELRPPQHYIGVVTNLFVEHEFANLIWRKY
jgi:hypothetical protein